MARDVCNIILYNKEKKILIQHRAENAKRMPWYWAFFGGGIEKDETPTQAVKREAFEELNYVLHKPEFILEQDFTREYGPSKKYVFIEEYDETQIIKIGEGQGLWRYHFSELTALKIIDHDMEVAKYINDKI